MLQTLWLQHLSKFVGYRSIGHICKLFNYSHLRCCFRVSKFHRFAVSEFQSFTASLFQCFKVSPLRCFNVSKFHRFAVSGFQSFTASLFQSFKVSPLRCFRVSKFHCFAVSRFHNSSHITHNSSPKLGEVPAGRRGLSTPKVNQDSVCLLWGKRRYELLSMIEQSDFIRATSLPNANATFYFPIQNLLKILFSTSCDVICPVTSPIACRQSCKSIDRNSPLMPSSSPCCTR